MCSFSRVKEFEESISVRAKRAKRWIDCDNRNMNMSTCKHLANHLRMVLFSANKLRNQSPQEATQCLST